MARHPLTSTLDFQDGVADNVTEDEIAKYRLTGDASIRKRIIQSHFRLILAMAYRRSSIDKSDESDLVSEGLMALTEAVDDACFKLEDNNITGFIVSRVRHRMRDFIDTNRIVPINGRTFRLKVSKGELDKDSENFNPHLLAVISIQPIALDNQERDHQGQIIAIVPEARRDTPEPELIEALELAVKTDRERRIIDLRKEGYTYEGIAEILGVSTSLIGQIMPKIEARFDRLYA